MTPVQAASFEPDPRRIDVLSPGELPYWSKALDVSEYDVLDAVDKVGTSAALVRLYLAGTSHRRMH